MKRQLWIVAMGVVTLTAGMGVRAEASPRARKALCGDKECTTVFGCDWDCTICKFDAHKAKLGLTTNAKPVGHCSPQ
jgi:hypothetical protein